MSRNEDKFSCFFFPDLKMFRWVLPQSYTNCVRDICTKSPKMIFFQRFQKFRIDFQNGTLYNAIVKEYIFSEAFLI